MDFSGKLITRDNEDRLKEALENLQSASTNYRLEEALLTSILEVTKAINNNFSTTQLLQLYEFVLREQLNIGKVTLFSKAENWKCQLSYGVGDGYNMIDIDNDVLFITEITWTGASLKPYLNEYQVTIPVYHKEKPLAYLLIGDINPPESEHEVDRNKHIPFVQTLTNIIVVAIENKKLAKAKIKQERTRKELELAAQMQSMLFPSELPVNDKLETGAVYMPHQEVGGDYYDFIKLNENEVAFCMADVSGKGVSAALLMSNFQANLQARFSHTNSLTELVSELNIRVMASAKGEKFITMFVAKYNISTRILTYINAGHNPPILYANNEVNQLKIGCTGLGMLDELPVIQEGKMKIESKSVLICYTDGVVELENDNHDEFGLEGLEKILLENNDKSIEELNNTILSKLESFKESRPYVDDIALFSCRMH